MVGIFVYKDVACLSLFAEGERLCVYVLFCAWQGRACCAVGGFGFSVVGKDSLCAERLEIFVAAVAARDEPAVGEVSSAVNCCVIDSSFAVVALIFV